MSRKPHNAWVPVASRIPDSARLALKVLLVGTVCYLGNKIGFANKIPPHNISALWPTIAILFAVLVASPPRHWWLYILAAYATSLVEDARAGFPLPARWFVAAGIIEVLVAASGVRRFAGGIGSFDSLRNLAAYLAIAVVGAPLVGAFVAAGAGATENYWFYWRTWLLSESIAYLALAPVILTWMNARPLDRKDGFVLHGVEAALIGLGIVAVWLTVFFWAPLSATDIPALVYLQLPFVLWAALRFGPPGSSATIFVVAALSITGAVHGIGPFATGSSGSNVLSLQSFLFVSSIPVMFLGTLVAERRQAATDAVLQRQEVAHLMRVSMLGGLSGSIAHEISQPLGAIRANAEAALHLLKDEPSRDSAKIREALNDIVEEDRRAAAVIQRLRNLIRKEQRKFEPIDIKELLDSTVDLLHAELLARGVTVRASHTDAALWVVGDPVQLQQVLLNLFINAMDAIASMQAAQRDITLSTSITETGAVQVEVRDRGPGIRAAEEDRLFEPFYTSKDHGLGLGLAISSTIMQAHGGTLGLANHAAGGAVATLLLPAHRRDPA